MKRTVKRVWDGDTFIVARKVQGTDRIRLANVYAPEKYQFGGSSATSKLKKLIGGKQVTLKPVGRSYNRFVAIVRHKRQSINKKMNSWLGR